MYILFFSQYRFTRAIETTQPINNIHYSRHQVYACKSSFYACLSSAENKSEDVLCVDLIGH